MFKLLLSVIMISSLNTIFSMELEILGSCNEETIITNLKKDLIKLDEAPEQEIITWQRYYESELHEEKKAQRERKKKLKLEEEHFPQELSYRDFYYIAGVEKGNKTLYYQINRVRDIERLKKKKERDEIKSLSWYKLKNGELYTIIIGVKKNKLLCLDQTSFPEHTTDFEGSIND